MWDQLKVIDQIPRNNGRVPHSFAFGAKGWDTTNPRIETRGIMADYAKAASDLKARLDAKARRTANLDAFFEALRVGLSDEAEQANSALTYEGAPTIEFKEGWSTGDIIVITCGTATATITQDREAPNVAANITSETGERSVTFIILPDESPATAQRVSLSPVTEPKIEPRASAATIIEELIASAP
jgi:hypothetical protein